MKILYVITQADGGGAQKYTLALAEAFGGTIAAGNEAKRLFVDAKALGIKCVELSYLKRAINPFYDIMAVWELRKLMQEERPDIVHLNSSKAGILGSFAAIGTKTKIVFTAHGFVFNELLPKAVKMFYLALEKIASGYRDHIIAVSNVDRQSALDNKLIDAKKITTVYNGLPQVPFLSLELARKELGLDENKIIVGSTSNFYRTKGLDILIDAVALMDEETKSKIQVAIIGEGPERKNLEVKIKNFRLENCVTLAGNISDVNKYLKAFDIFVLPSRKEGFPFAILEAMQAGLPIIATNVGGIPESLGDAGILIAPENPKALAGAMQSLLTDLPKQKDLAQKALQRSKLFTEEKMLAETEKAYELVMEK